MCPLNGLPFDRGDIILIITALPVHFYLGSSLFLMLSFAFPGTLMDCYDELGNRYQLPVYVLGSPTNLIEDTSESEAGQEADSNNLPGIETVIKFRLSSTNKDLKVKVRTTDTMLKIKKRLFEMEKVEPSRQRFFYAGKMLNDKLKIEDVKIPKGNVIQVIVSPSETEEIS